MENSVQGMNDVCEGCIETIDFQNERGVIEVATPNERVPLPSKIEFPLAELRVAAEDWSYVEEKTKVTFRLHGTGSSGTRAYEVTPIENELCFAQVYSVAEDYCKVLIWKYQTLANVDLKSVRRIVPHHFCLTAKENCVVAVPWPELSKASAEKRLPIVHLLALHDSKAEAEAAVNLDASAGSEIAAAPVPIGLPVPSPHQEHGETSSDSDLARTPSPQPIEFRDFETGSPRCPRDFHLSRVEGFCGIAPKRDQLQMAYWSGVRDGALRYQQLMSPCYASMNPPLNELPMKYNTVNRLFHNT